MNINLGSCVTLSDLGYQQLACAKYIFHDRKKQMYIVTRLHKVVQLILKACVHTFSFLSWNKSLICLFHHVTTTLKDPWR